MVRAKGIEPLIQAWEAHVLPLYYARIGTPGGSRTLNLLIRSQALCPIELRVQKWRDGRDSNPRPPA